jgi:hypothetical protein
VVLLTRVCIALQETSEQLVKLQQAHESFELEYTHWIEEQVT